MKLDFSPLIFEKKAQTSNFNKIRTVETELLHTDRYDKFCERTWKLAFKLETTCSETKKPVTLKLDAHTFQMERIHGKTQKCMEKQFHFWKSKRAAKHPTVR